MRRTEILVATGALAMIALAAPPVLAAPFDRVIPSGRAGGAGFAFRGYVIGNGGNPSAGGLYRLNGTVGQAAVGMSSGASHSLCHGFWCSGGPGVVSVDDPPPQARLPEEFALGLAAPNPATGAVAFSLALPAAARIELQVHDVQGRLVRRTSERFDPGWHRLLWNGADESGRPVESGVYFARVFVNGDHSGLRRIVIRR